MRIPETPNSVSDLDLMKRLDLYAKGEAQWRRDGTTIGPKEQKECGLLYSHIIAVVEKAINPLLDRINDKEMDTFTLHDTNHGMKVAHIMWHILSEERKNHLSPSEIALMVYSAFIHDIGMFLTEEERRNRLDPNSDLWEQLDFDVDVKAKISILRSQIYDQSLPDCQRDRLIRDLYQAEEALLCKDTRENHSTSKRYNEIIENLQAIHNTDHSKIPDIYSALSFHDDRFDRMLVDICVSHCEDYSALIERDKINSERPRFPREMAIGNSTADALMIAAALRMADILDFDRERTPPVLFHYFFPGPFINSDNKAKIEWSKHLSISNWSIEENNIIFKGNCDNYIVHHAIANFCNIIHVELESTLKLFYESGSTMKPFVIPSEIKCEITEIDYKYMPYRFELDDERVYKLLMGGSIYEDPLMSIRELIQNAVDACKFKDRITLSSDPSIIPINTDRIEIKYCEPESEGCQPKLIVTDTGSGMDKTIIENYLLKVGKSYYDSIDFNKYRIQLRKTGNDFAPISEFGIGILSCFLISDRIEIKTSIWENLRNDTKEYNLIIDGPTRLIKINENPNSGINRFRGTCVTLHLVKGSRKNKLLPPSWEEVLKYIKSVCVALEYDIKVIHCENSNCVEHIISPITYNIERNSSEFISIPLDSPELGIRGVILIGNAYNIYQKNKDPLTELDAVIDEELDTARGSYVFTRGGFPIFVSANLPESPFKCNMGRIALTWEGKSNKRYHLPNLSRTSISNSNEIRNEISKQWFSFLLDNPNPRYKEYLFLATISGAIDNNDLLKWQWLEKYSAFDLYKFIRNIWLLELKEVNNITKKDIEEWESGNEILIYDSYNIGRISSTLLSLILPIICRKARDNKSIYLRSPKDNWREILQLNHSFITNRVNWGPFAEYLSPIEDFFLYTYPGWLPFNEKFRDKVSIFTSDELFILGRIYYSILNRSGYKVPRTNEAEYQLLIRSKDEIGDLLIGHRKNNKFIKDIAIKYKGAN
jgi:hypothetical protein